MNYGSPQQIVKIGPNAYRLLTKPERHDSVQPGDIIKIPQKMNLRSPHGLRLEECKAVTLEKVTIESAPCFALYSGWGEDILLDHVRVVPGPTPPGATEPRIFSSSADGLNLEDNTRGPVIRNCTVASNGDDGIAIYNKSDSVIGQEKDGAIVVGLFPSAPRDKVYFPGDTLRFFLAQTLRTEERKIVTVEANASPSDLEQVKQQFSAGIQAHKYGRAVRVNLDSPLTVAPGDLVIDTRYAGRGFEITNNVLVNNASRGMNICQSYGSISHNCVYHSFLPGIHVTGAGDYGFQTSIDIKDNVVTDASVGFPARKDWKGAISIVAWGTGPVLDGNSHISITGNVINQLNGIGIQVLCASQVMIEDNVFGSVDKFAAPDLTINFPALSLDEVHDAEIKENVVAGTGWSASPEIKMTSSCHDISAEVPFLLSFPTR